jgi:hypothetical protein
MYIVKKFNLILISSTLFFSNNIMEWPKQEDIPKSIIKGKGAIAADLSSLKGKGKILFVNPKCVVIGLGDTPYRLFITPDFHEENLPSELQKHIFDVKELILKPTFSVGTSKRVEYCSIPKWLTKFNRIELLRFEYVELDNLKYLKELPVHHLIIENIKYLNSKTVITAIKQFRQLKEVSYDGTLPQDIKNAMMELNLKLTPVEKRL